MSAPTAARKHHEKDEFCTTRAKYREGREQKAVKVYTVNQESRYLLIQGVPALGTQQELVKVFALYGPVEEYRLLDEYPAEEFTEVFWIKYKNIQSARIAKKKLDDYSFYGGVLHVCYAPEYESVQDTREKLQERRKAIARKTRHFDAEKARQKPVTAPSSSVSTVPATEQDRAGPRGHVANHSTPETSISHDQHTTDSSAAPPSGNSESRTDVIPLALPPPPQVLPPWEQQRVPPAGFHQRPPDYDPHGPSVGHFRGADHTSMPPGHHPFHGRPPFRHPGHWNGPGHWPRGHQPPYPGHPAFRSQPPFPPPPQHQTDTNICPDDGPNISSKTQERTIDGLIVRDYKATTKAAPRFVPRQLTKKPQHLKRLANDNADNPSAKKPKTEVETEANLELKKNAFILGSVAGPTLPAQEEKRRQVFLQSDMGNVSLEETMMKIRQKVKEFSAKALPPQVLKKLKR